MTRNSPIDSKRAGERNERLILSLLRTEGPMSQTELCQRLKIGSSTASTIVARLREKNLLTEHRSISDRRGPKPVTLALNPHAYGFLAVEINPNGILLGLFDFIGHLISKFLFPLSSQERAPSSVATLLSQQIQMVFEIYRLVPQRCRIGITLSGTVSDGMVHLSSPMGWKDVPLAQMLTSPIPVQLFSNRIRLLAEIQRDRQLAQQDIAYLNVANGVGVSVYSKRILSGSSGRYGEIGHTVIDPNGPMCGCGHRGCLEAHISGPALVRQILSDKQNGAQTALLAGADTHDPQDALADWPQLAQTDAYAASLRDRTIQLITNAAAAVINAYDPNILILGGYVNQLWYDRIVEQLRQSMDNLVYDAALRRVDIRPAQAGPDALLVGVYEALMQQMLAVD